MESHRHIPWSWDRPTRLNNNVGHGTSDLPTFTRVLLPRHQNYLVPNTCIGKRPQLVCDSSTDWIIQNQPMGTILIES